MGSSAMIAILQTIINGGVIGVVVLIAYFIWGKSGNGNSKILNNPLITLAIIVILLAGATYTEYLKTLRSHDQNSELLKEAIKQTFMEPFFKDGKWKYEVPPGGGLEMECSDEYVFNQFDERSNYTLKGMWADPNGAWIKAEKTNGSLVVNFNRLGYGVDLTIFPSDRKPRLLDRVDSLVITLKNTTNSPVAFRLRVTDERQTQWQWADQTLESKTKTNEQIWLDYKRKDGNGVVMTAEAKPQPQRFSFPLVRSGWNLFPNDGNIAFPSFEKKFKVLQFVTLELGTDDSSSSEKGNDHNKHLLPSPHPEQIVILGIGMK